MKMGLSITEFSRALLSLDESMGFYLTAVKDSQEQKAFRDACIQRFEYCIELAWKISMKQLGSTVAAAKPAVREMARNNLIRDPSLWIEFIEARNNTSHSYDEDVAKKVFVEIGRFLPEAKALELQLRKLTK